MKTLLVFCCMVLIAVTSCQKSSLNPVTSPAAQRKPLTSAAMQNVLSNGAFIFNNHIDIALATPGSVQVNPCTGESLQITSGTLQLDFHETINNNTLNFDQHANIQNYKLVGLSSGIEYTGSNNSTTKAHTSLNNGLFVVTETMSALLTTPGGQNNPRVKFDLHLTFTPQGTLTALVDNFSASCQ
jgi:hypothetical protein